MRGSGREQQFLEAGAGKALKASPVLNGDKDRGFDASPGHYLRSFGDAGCQQFAETRLGFLYLPHVVSCAPSELDSDG